MKKIYLGADHAGFALKEKVKRWIRGKKIAFEDLGNLIYDKDDDYPDFAERVGKRVVKEKVKGILFCGSAEGMAMAANKVKGVRAVAVWDKKIAELSRKHNDANVLCLAGGGMLKPIPGLSLGKAKEIISVWLRMQFSGEARHKRRIEKIRQIEIKEKRK